VSDVREINGLDQLAEYRHDWRRLLEQTPRASFFQTSEWLEAYWRHCGAGQKLRVLVICEGGRTAGIVPLVVRREQTRVGALRVLTYPLADWGSFFGPLGPAPEATLTAGLRYVREARRDWDLLELRWIDPDAGHRQMTEAAMRCAGLQAHATVWNRTAVVDLAGAWEDYLAARPAKWRNNLRRAERRLREQGKLEVVHYRPLGDDRGDGSPRWDLYDACEDVAERSWQGTSTTGTTLSHPSIRPFLRDVHESAAGLGAVDVHLLFLDDQPLAFAYNYYWQGRVEGLRAGYDAAVSRDGAGSLLLAWAIREGFRRGDRVYDLGIGSLQCKRHLATRVVPIYRCSHFAAGGLRTQLVRLKRSWQAHLVPRP